MKKQVKEKNHELEFLSELSSEINNIGTKKNKASKLKNTYILSQYGSKQFGLEMIEKDLVLGIPVKLFDKMFNVSWVYACIIEGSGGLYLVFKVNINGEMVEKAVRVFLKSNKINAIKKFNTITIVPINNKNKIELSAINQMFELNLFKKPVMDWE